MQEVEEMVEEADVNNDGQVNYTARSGSKL
jgi:hypothetical protein